MICLQSVARRSVTNVMNLLSGRLHRQKRSTEDTTVLPSMSLPQVIQIYMYTIKPVLRGHLWVRGKWCNKTGDFLKEVQYI